MTLQSSYPLQTNSVPLSLGGVTMATATAVASSFLLGFVLALVTTRGKGRGLGMRSG